MDDFRAQMLSNVKSRERSILKNVYLWMTAGLGLTGVVAYLVASSEALMNMFYTGYTLMFVVFAELALVFYLSARLQKMSTSAAVLSFAGYAILNGITLSGIFMAFGSLSISRAFFATAGLFGGMSLYGMTTKRQLDGIGHYLIMALWGVIVASVVNMFVKSNGLDFIVSIIGVLLFVGLTAWDTQKIKRINDAYSGHMDEDTFVKLSIIGALTLYLDFLNIFLYLLRFFGRNDR